jgi:hypothetical protein
MQRHFARLDDALIERVFQPLADAITQRFGLGRLRAACFCLDGASIAWILSQSRGLGEAATAWHAGDASLRGILLLLGLVAMSSLRTLFQRLGADGSSGSPLRRAMLPHRAVVLALLAGRTVNADGMEALADMAMLALAAAALYLGACAAPPPVRRRSSDMAQAGV